MAGKCFIIRYATYCHPIIYGSGGRAPDGVWCRFRHEERRQVLVTSGTGTLPPNMSLEITELPKSFCYFNFLFIEQKVLGFSQNPVPFAQKSVGFGRKAPPFIKVP